MFRAGLVIWDGGTQLIMEVGGAQVNNRGCRGSVNCQDWRSSANYLSQPLLFQRQQGGLGSPERLRLRFHLQEGRENGALSSARKFSRQELFAALKPSGEEVAAGPGGPHPCLSPPCGPSFGGAGNPREAQCLGITAGIVESHRRVGAGN